MHPYTIFVLIYTIAVVQADLTCLEWGLISPVVGLFCHFEPTYFKTAEDKTATVVEEAVESVKDLVKFDLTHNPAAVTYNFIEETEQGGIKKGSQYLNNVTQDFENVAIGFGKETSNQVLTILKYTYWNDLSLCLIKGATDLALNSQRRKVKRIGLHGTSALAKGHDMFMSQAPTNNTASMPQLRKDSAAAMAHQCISDKFKQLAKPVTFHINDSNQKVGSTISDIATFLIPVGGDEKVAAAVVEGPVDLVIPGSESSTRIVKMVDKNIGDHFTNKAEAQSVANKMEEEAWVKENCGICGDSPVPLSNLISKKKRFNRRGNSMATCCRVPHVIEGEEAAINTDVRYDNYVDPIEYYQIREGNLVPAPELITRNIELASDRKALWNDLASLSTGLITWSPELTRVMGSDELLSTLREVFTESSSPLHRALSIRAVDDGFRFQSSSMRWLYSRDPVLKPLQDWANAAIKQGKDTVLGLKGWDETTRIQLKGEVHFFYTPPNEKALVGTDFRQFHLEAGHMEFSVADVPGLVIINQAKNTASRVPVAKNAFHLLQSAAWDFFPPKGGVSYYSEFGPEMAEKGRVSVFVRIRSKHL